MPCAPGRRGTGADDPQPAGDSPLAARARAARRLPAPRRAALATRRAWPAPTTSARAPTRRRRSATVVALARAAYGRASGAAEADEARPARGRPARARGRAGARACSAWRRAGTCRKRCSERCAGTGGSPTARRRERCARPTSPITKPRRSPRSRSTTSDRQGARRESARVEDTPIAGLKRVRRSRLGDQRGFLARLFCADELRDAGWNAPVAQINHTCTRRARQRSRPALPASAARREEARPAACAARCSTSPSTCGAARRPSCAGTASG